MILTIIIDQGHASNTGSTGNGREEHEVAGPVARHLADALGYYGHDVTLLDYPSLSNKDDLRATIAAANKSNADIGISIHMDWAPSPSSRGAHVCYVSSAGKRLAQAIATPLCALLPGRDESITKRTDLAVLKETNPTWVLVECGFITSPEDVARVCDNPLCVALTIAEGINAYARQLQS